MRHITVFLLIMLFTTTLAWALPVPINGDFENADVYTADQWNIDGPWRFRGNENHDGRRSASIREYEVLSGDRLTSNSGIVVNNDAIVLNGFYKGHGFIAGIEIVDLLGTVVDSVRTDVFDVADEFAPFSVTWKPTTTVESGTLLWARAFVEATDGAEGIVDDLSFSENGLRGAFAATGASTQFGPTSTGSLCPDIAPERTTSGSATGGKWAASDSGVQTAVEAGGFNNPACLLLTGGADFASWTTSLSRLDVSLPHRLSFNVASHNVSPDSTAYAALVVFDDQMEKVYYAAAMPIAPGQQTFDALIPGLEKLPTSARGQLSLVIPANFEGQVRFSDVTVVADPHLPTIKAARQQIAVFPDAKSVSFFAQVPNKVDTVTQMVTHIKTVNRDGEAVAYEKRAMSVAPRAVALFPASPRPKYNDAYSLVIRVQAAADGRTLAYGEYPFVISPAQPDDPKNYSFGVMLHELADEGILSAATAGAGWITVPVEYSADADNRALAVQLRDLRKIARQAEKYNVKLAVQMVFPAASKLTTKGFTDFFGTVHWWLGDRADAYILGLSKMHYADATDTAAVAAGADVAAASKTAVATIQAMIATIKRFQTGYTVDSAILLPAGTLKWLADVEAENAPAAPIVNEAPAADAAPAAGAVPAPVTTVPAVDAAATIAQPIVPTPGAIFEVAYQGNLDSAGEWIVPLSLSADKDADAMLAREAALALSGDAAVVIIPNFGDTALLSETYAATANWASFWTLCSQLQGKQFAGGTASGNIQWLRFDGPDGDTVVAWALKDKQEAVLSGDLADAVKTTIRGQESPLTTIMGRATITLDAQPLYINIPSKGGCRIQAGTGATDSR